MTAAWAVLAGVLAASGPASREAEVRTALSALNVADEAGRYADACRGQPDSLAPVRARVEAVRARAAAAYPGLTGVGTGDTDYACQRRSPRERWQPGPWRRHIMLLVAALDTALAR